MVPFSSPHVGWVILSPAETRIKRKIEEAGRPLKEWDVNIYRGILTGYNDAFIIDGNIKDQLLRKCPEAAEIIRPVLKGEDIFRYGIKNTDQWLLNTHNGLRNAEIAPINVQFEYPAVFEYLNQTKFKPKIEIREDQGSHWTNLRNCAYQSEFDKPKIIWGNLNIEASFAFDNERRYIIAPSNLLTSSSHNLYYLLAILNSSVTTFFMKRQGYSREGGYIEYKKVFIEQLSVAAPSPKLEEICTTYIQEIITMKKNQMNTKPIEDEIDNLIFDLYNFDNAERVLLVKSRTSKITVHP